MQHRVLIINGAVHYIQVLMAMFVTLYTYVIDSQVKFSLVAQEKIKTFLGGQHSHRKECIN